MLMTHTRRVGAAAMILAVGGLLAGYSTLWLPAARGFSVALLPGWDTGLVAMGVNALVVA